MAAFAQRGVQAAFSDALPGGARDVSLLSECRSPTDARLARARVRHATGGSDSEASEVVARDLGERFVSTILVGDERCLAVDTRPPVAPQVDEVASYLDALLAGDAA